MSLDVTLTETRPVDVYSANITHILVEMAKEADLYMFIWHPDEIGITEAYELIRPLTVGLNTLRGDPDRFKAFNPRNDRGSYDDLVEFVEDYLAACIKSPDADVSVYR